MAEKDFVLSGQIHWWILSELSPP